MRVLSNVLILLLCLASLALVCNAQLYYNLKDTIYTNAGSNGNALAIASAGGPAACTSTVFILRAGSNCVAIAANDSTYGVTLEVCPPSLLGATSLSCANNTCYVLNPATQNIVVLNNTATGTNIVVVATISISTITNPRAFSVYQRNASFVDILIVDGANTVWLYTVNTPVPSIVAISSLPAVFTGTPVGIFMYTPTTFMIATANATTLATFALTSSTSVVFPGITFGNIRYITLDGFGFVHVYDAACSCIKVVDPTGAIVTNVSSTNPVFISPSRKKIFVVDALGITKFEDAPRIAVSSTPVTCEGRNGTINAQVAGGDFPLTAAVFPDYVWTVMNSPGNATFGAGATNYLQAYPVTLFDEGWARLWVIQTDPSVRKGMTMVTAKTGNWSYFIQFTAGETVQMNWQQQNPLSFSSTMFESTEFWINVGLGGQKLQIAFNTYLMFINPGDLPLNTWVQYKFHIPRSLFYLRNVNGFYTMFKITDLLRTANQNPFYIDSFIITPYPATYPDRMLYIFDRCFQTTSTIVPMQYRPLQVTVTPIAASCNADTTTTVNKTSDGGFVANVMYGTPPYTTYKWNYTSTVSTAPNITGQAPQQNYITVYDDAVNSTWRDVSLCSSCIMNDTRHVRSGQYSIAFTPIETSDSLIFTVQQEVQCADFNLVEFWIYGGDTGNQSLNVWMYKMVAPSSSISAFGGISVVQNTAGTYLLNIPPNKWVKASFPSGFYDRFSVITISNLVPNTGTSNNLNFSSAQATLWIDDIVIVGSKSVISVTDSSGCRAFTNRARMDKPPALTQNVLLSNAKCYGSSDGSVSVQMGGGAPPYTYSWSNSIATESSLDGLPEGNVSVVATDSNGCDYQAYNAVVLQPPPITIAPTTVNPVCYGGTGRITATVAGGSGQYTYAWTNPTGAPRTIPRAAPEPIFIDEPTVPFNLLYARRVCAGTGNSQTTYSPSHSGYCSMYLSFDSVTPTTGIVGCASCLTPSKHSTLSFYLLADSQTALNSLSVAFVRDTNWSSTFVRISDLGTFSPNTWNKIEIDFNIVYTNARPDGIVFFSSSPGNMGTVIVDDIVVLPNVANGAGFSTYSGFVSEIEVVATQYFLNVFDSNGCTLPNTFTVTQPAEIKVLFTTQAPSYVGANDGSVTAVATGGTPPYSYLWNDTQETTPTLGDHGTGTYKLIVTDGNGCVVEFTAIIPPFDQGVTIRAYNRQLSGGLAAIAGSGVLICIFSAVMLLVYWASFSKLGSFLSFTILLGCASAFVSALVLLPQPTDALCIAFPWLLGIGFMLVYGCLFLKTWAMYQVWRQAVQYHKANLTAGHIMRSIGFAVLIEAIFLAIWTAVEPPKAMLVQTVNNTLEWQCDVEHPTFWIIFIAGKGVWLLFGAMLSILTRNVVKEYNESQSIAYAIYNNVLLGTIAIPLTILIKETPGGRVVVEVVVITLAFSFTLVVMFFRIWHTIMLPDKIVSGGKLEAATKRTTASSSGSSVKSTHSSDGKSSHSSH